MQLNKISSIKTIDRVAKELGENDDFLHEISIGMEPEDGVIWVYGLTGDGVMAFSDFGVENLCELITMHREELCRPPSK